MLLEDFFLQDYVYKIKYVNTWFYIKTKNIQQYIEKELDYNFFPFTVNPGNAVQVRIIQTL